VLRLVALGATAAATIVFTSARVKPVFLDKTLASRLSALSATSDERALLLAPWSRLPFTEALATSTFLRDRSAFAMDLMGTGKVGLTRALALADVAVREAYRRQVPPALVLGVLLTENDELKSSATSSVGAVGLMQVYPKHWLGALAHRFGTNIGTDSTNLKYGIYILAYLAGQAADAENVKSSWRRALLRYNGCVNGTNTPECHMYPDVVRRQVQRSAKSSCAGVDFERCVVEPLWLARRDDAGDTVSGLR